jgi:MFS family permease
MSASRWRSYTIFLGTNHQFRRFWLAGVISQFGNWFNYIAIFVLLDRLSGSGQAISWFLIAKFIPSTILGPAAGIMADRLSRKAIMIGSDLIRAGVVLCFLVVRSPEQIWLIYLLAFTQEAFWTFSNPARQASVPNLCQTAELNIANALSGATWSVLLAFGAATGGFVTAAAGWQTAIKIDAITFLISAFLLYRTTIPRRQSTEERPSGLRKKLTWRNYTGVHDLATGIKYVLNTKKVAALLLVKSGWALSGGILVMLVVFGEQLFNVSSNGGGSGILYSCRGIGAAVGPILAWRILGEDPPSMMRGIALSFFVSAGAYIAFSMAPSLLWAAPFVLLGHIGGAIQWVFSTTLLQRIVDDQYRGRVFAAEMGIVTLVLSVSMYCTGAALDLGISPRHVALSLALLFLMPGTLWQIYLYKKRKNRAPEKLLP